MSKERFVLVSGGGSGTKEDPYTPTSIYTVAKSFEFIGTDTEVPTWSSVQWVQKAALRRDYLREVGTKLFAQGAKDGGLTLVHVVGDEKPATPPRKEKKHVGRKEDMPFKELLGKSCKDCGKTHWFPGKGTDFLRKISGDRIVCRGCYTKTLNELAASYKDESLSDLGRKEKAMLELLPEDAETQQERRVRLADEKRKQEEDDRKAKLAKLNEAEKEEE